MKKCRFFAFFSKNHGVADQKTAAPPEHELKSSATGWKSAALNSYLGQYNIAFSAVDAFTFHFTLSSFHSLYDYWAEGRFSGNSFLTNDVFLDYNAHNIVNAVKRRVGFGSRSESPGWWKGVRRKKLNMALEQKRR